MVHSAGETSLIIAFTQFKRIQNRLPAQFRNFVYVTNENIEKPCFKFI